MIDRAFGVWIQKGGVDKISNLWYNIILQCDESNALLNTFIGNFSIIFLDYNKE